MPVRAALIGFGKLGRDVGAALSWRRDVEIVAVIDSASELRGRRASEVAPDVAFTGEVEHEVPRDLEADVGVVVTTSRVHEVGTILEALAGTGIATITSAEELAFPWREFPTWSVRLDRAAKEGSVAILGVGTNPGFLMDALPLVLSAPQGQVAAVRTSRTLDLRPHRQARLERFGLGLTESEFSSRSPAQVYGHVGFRQSVDMLAYGLDLRPDAIAESPLRPVVISETERIGDLVTIPARRVAVTSQSIRATTDGVPVVEFNEYFGFIEPSDPFPIGDSIELEGLSQSYRVSFDPGVDSFNSTPSIIANLAVAVPELEPGLRTSLDLRTSDWAARRVRATAGIGAA